MAIWLAGTGALLGLIGWGFGGLVIGGVSGYMISLLYEIRQRLDRMESALELGRPVTPPNVGWPRHGKKTVPAGELGADRYPEQVLINGMQEEDFDEHAAEDFDRYYRDVNRPRTRGGSR